MERNNLYDLEKTLKLYINRFLGIVRGINRKGFDEDYREKAREIEASGFPIFSIEDEEYYKNKYIEGKLEAFIRDELINRSFDYMFKSYGYDIRWVNGKNGEDYRTIGDRNKDVEDRFGVEFFVVNEGRNFAFRYTKFEKDFSVPNNLPKELLDAPYYYRVDRIDKWVSIDWSGMSKDELVSRYRLENEDENGYQVTKTLEEFFEDFFSKDDYRLFVELIYDAVKKAKELLTYQTISRLDYRNLFLFKQEVISRFMSRKYDEMTYKRVDINGEVISKDDSKTEQTIFTPIDSRRFYGLIGRGLFAKSFITSEYLYGVFGTGVNFDYTSVVSGYIKTVEQLYRTIIFDILMPMNNEKLYFLANQSIAKSIPESEAKKVGRFIYVKMKNTNRIYYIKELTMGQMVFFFEVNKQELFRRDDQKRVDYFIDCMKNYVDFDRNGFFHKHNIEDYSVVNRIQNNTYLILYWLLGGLKLTGNDKNDLATLEIVDDSFDKLFRQIAYCRWRSYYLRLHKDEDEKKVIRLLTKPEYEIDSDGYLQGAQLAFLEVDEFPTCKMDYWLLLWNRSDEKGNIEDKYKGYNEVELDDDLGKSVKDDDKIIIDRENMPFSIMMADIDGNKKPILM